jgi:hypothetical protein
VVVYRWHPWHGRAVIIVGVANKAEQAVYRCVLELADGSRPLEVPQWMFDAAACCRIALAPKPAVPCATLRELIQLISSVWPPDGAAMLQAEHLTTPDPGGACATQEILSPSRPDESVLWAGGDSEVGGVAA